MEQDEEYAQDFHEDDQNEPETEEEESSHGEMFVSISPTDMILLSSHSPPHTQSWILDSGATDHCTTELSDFIHYTPIPDPYLINGICCLAVGKGNIFTKTTTSDGQHIPITITDALYVPSLKERSDLIRPLLMQTIVTVTPSAQ